MLTMEVKLILIVCVSFGMIEVRAQINGVDYENAVIVSSLMTNTFSSRNVHITMIAGTLYAMSGNTFNGTTFGLSHISTQILSMEVDYGRKRLYIVDINVGVIYVIPDFDWQSNFTNLQIEVFHNGLSRALVRLGLDWISNNVYWTDELFNWIVVQSADKSDSFKILIRENLERPYALAVDPINRYLFWSDVGSSVKIERATLLGQDRKTIISTGVAFPTSIDIDQKANKIVWVDSIRDTIESANFDGSERRAIRRISHSSFYDVAVFQDLICATSLQNNTMVIVNKNTGSIFNVLRNLRNNPVLALAIYSKTAQPLQTDVCKNSGCSDICIPDASGPICLCREGYMLSQDRKTCTEDLGKFHRAFVWSNKTHICLMDIRILTTIGHADVKECVYTQGSNVSYLDIDMNERKIIFADGSDIFVVDLEQVNVKTRLVASDSPITGLSLDWRDSNVYWSEGVGSGSIKIVSQTTMAVYTLVNTNLVSPRNLLLLPLIDSMFWISGVRGTFVIERSKLDGSNRKVLVTMGSLTNPVSLTADTLNDRIYFIDNGFVKSCKADGTDLKVFVSDPAFFGPIMAHLYQNYLVVADNDFPVGKMKSIDKSDGSLTYSQTAINVNTLTDMAVLDASLQPDQKGPCEVFNGGCEQICISIGRNRICQCEYGFQLDPNRETCSSAPLLDNFFLVTDWTHNKIYQVSLDNNEIRAVDTETFGSPVGVEYNNVTQYVIWSSEYNVHQVNIKTGDYQILLNTESYGYEIDRFAIDHTSGNIYYTAVPDNQLDPGIVAVLSPSGRHKKLISDGSKPRAIAVDPEDGLLFWTDHGSNPPFVKKANMDGTNAQTIISSGIVWPNGLAIDTAAKRLYLADGATNIIQRCTYQGVCTVFHTDTEAHLMDIKLLGDYLYYTAWNRVYVTKLKKTDSTDITRLAEKAEFGRLDSLTLYSLSLSKQTVSLECLPNNGLGPCSTFCLPKTIGYTCGCEDGIMLLNNGKTCENAETTTTTATTSTSTTSMTTTTLPSSTSTTSQTTSALSTSTLSTSPKTSLGEHEDENSQLPLAAIGGGVGGFVVFIIIAVVIIVLFLLKRSRRKNNQQPSTIHKTTEGGFDMSSIYRGNNDGPYLTSQRPDTTYDLITFDVPKSDQNDENKYERLYRDMPTATLAPTHMQSSALPENPNDYLRVPASNQQLTDSNRTVSDAYLLPIQSGHTESANGAYPFESESVCTDNKNQSVTTTAIPISTISYP